MPVDITADVDISGITGGNAKINRTDMSTPFNNLIDILNDILNGVQAFDLITAANGTFTGIDINGGTADGMVLGGTTPAAATVTTLTAGSGNVVLGNGDDTIAVSRDSNVYNTFSGFGTGIRVVIAGKRGRGTAVSPSMPQSGDYLLEIEANGWDADGDFMRWVAGIMFKATETWTNSAKGTGIEFQTTANGTETKSTKMTLNDSGRLDLTAGLQVGTNLGMGTTTFGTNANLVIAFLNGTAPTTSPSNTVQLYATSGELRVRDASSNTTTLSPHPADAPFDRSGRESTHAYYEINHRTNREVWLDNYGALEALEALTNEQFIYTRRLKPGQRENPYARRYLRQRQIVREKVYA